MSITHPPMTRIEFDEIAGKLDSAEALLLFREIERLRAIERLTRLAMELPEGVTLERLLVRNHIADAMAGILHCTHRFGTTTMTFEQARKLRDR